MAKRVQKSERVDVEVEVVGVVKHDGEYAEPGSRILLTADQAARLIATGHVKAIQKSKVKIQDEDGAGHGVVPGAEGASAG